MTESESGDESREPSIPAHRRHERRRPRKPRRLVAVRQLSEKRLQAIREEVATLAANEDATLERLTCGVLLTAYGGKYGRRSVIEVRGESGGPVDTGSGDRDGEPDPRHYCTQPAGMGTDHPGFGPCKWHGGNTAVERARGAWMMAHAFVADTGEDVAPWSVLIGILRRQVIKSRWYHEKLAEVTDDEALLPGGSHFDIVRLADEADKTLMTYVRNAIGAGLAERVVQQQMLDGQAIAEIFTRVLGRLQLDEVAAAQARSTIRAELLAIEVGDMKA